MRTEKRGTEQVTSQQLSQIIVQGMVDKKGVDVVVLDLRGIKNAVADFFILCSGTSDIQVGAITDSIEEVVWKNTRQDPWHREGKGNKEWVLLDYSDCVAHVFQRSVRDFYKIEQLWGDAEFTWYGEDGQPLKGKPMPMLQFTS